MRLHVLIPALVFLFYFSACKGKKDETEQSCLAQEKFFKNGQCLDEASGLKGAKNRFTFVADAPFLESLVKPVLNICILHESASPEVLSRVQNEAKASIFAWINPISDLGGIATNDVVFQNKLIDAWLPYKESATLAESVCGESDAYIFVVKSLITSFNPTERAFATPTRNHIYINFDDTSSTILHETGHLFGLGDIYQEGIWTCKPGFPNSIMCESRWGQLMPSDRESVRRSYCLSTLGANEACFNHAQDSLLAIRTPDILLDCKDADSRFILSTDSAYFIRGTGPTHVQKILTPVSSDETSVRESYSEDSVRWDLDFQVDLGQHYRGDAVGVKVRFSAVGIVEVESDLGGAYPALNSYSNCRVHHLILDVFTKRAFVGTAIFQNNRDYQEYKIDRTRLPLFEGT